MMPRVKPAPSRPRRASAVCWADVAGLEEVEGRAHGGGRLPPQPGALRAPRRARAEGHPALRAARHRQDADGEGRRVTSPARTSTRRAPRRSSRCSPASARRASASSSRRRARTRPRSSSSTSSTPSAPRARGHGFNREQDQTLNQLLVELDGFGASEHVVVMGASNRLQDLDPALLRPGRFDRQMLVSPPDLAGREAILERAHARQAARGGRRPAR